MNDRLAVGLQYLLPNQALTAFAGLVARWRGGAMTTTIIRWFVGRYKVDMARAAGDDDRVFEDQGVRIYVDAASLPLVDGTEIDFVKNGLNEQFVFRNPNVAGECGCGESFTTDADKGELRRA